MLLAAPLALIGWKRKSKYFLSIDGIDYSEHVRGLDLNIGGTSTAGDGPIKLGNPYQFHPGPTDGVQWVKSGGVHVTFEVDEKRGVIRVLR